jgi:hypothetical protein
VYAAANELSAPRGRVRRDRISVAMHGPLLATQPQPSHATPMVCSVSQGVHGYSFWCAPSIADQARVHRAEVRLRDPGRRVGRSVSCADAQSCPIHKIRQQRLMGII